MADLEEVKAMVEGGMSVSAIAEELGVSSSRASQLISAMGLSGSVVRRSALSRLTREQITEAIQMYEDEEPVALITIKYGLSYNSFYKLLAQEGVAMRERGVENKTARDIRLNQAVEMYKLGHTLYQIEVETGIRQPVLHRELSLRGVPRKRAHTFTMNAILEELNMEDPTPMEAEMLDAEDDLEVMGRRLAKLSKDRIDDRTLFEMEEEDDL